MFGDDFVITNGYTKYMKERCHLSVLIKIFPSNVCFPPSFHGTDYSRSLRLLFAAASIIFMAHKLNQ